MTNKEIALTVPIPVGTCYDLLASFRRVDVFSLTEADPANYTLKWRKGLGWTNPITIQAKLEVLSSDETEVFLAADIFSFGDPYGILTKAISKFEERIRVILNEIQNGRMCPRCLTQVSVGIRFCPKDGTPIAFVCPNCSHANLPNSQFCTHCGALLG